MWLSLESSQTCPPFRQSQTEVQILAPRPGAKAHCTRSCKTRRAEVTRNSWARCPAAVATTHTRTFARTALLQSPSSAHERPMTRPLECKLRLNTAEADDSLRSEMAYFPVLGCPKVLLREKLPIALKTSRNKSETPRLHVAG